MNNLSRYKIVTDLAFKDIMGFKVGTITNIDAALKMVEAGRLDGVISASNVVDPILNMYRMSNIRRTFYGTFDVKALIAKNKDTQQINAMLSKTAQEMKLSPEVEILSSNFLPYERFN